MATHYQNKTVYAAATTSFVAWLDMDPQNSNWWWMEIGVPRIVARTLLLLNNTSLLPKAAPLLDRATIPGALGMTGCNTVWVASANVLRAAFEGNRTLMQQAFDAIHVTYKVNIEGVISATSTGMSLMPLHSSHLPSLSPPPPSLEISRGMAL
jgi:hypothetical protein